MTNTAEDGVNAAEDAGLDPLAMALFGARDHVRHHLGCADVRGIGGHHYHLDNECALANIIKRYGDRRASEAWDERDAARPQYLGPDGGHYPECMGWEDCYCASYPNPYRT